MCRVSRPRAVGVAGLRWHTALSSQVASGPPRAAVLAWRVSGGSLFFRPRHIQVLGWTLLRCGVVGRWGRRELRMEPSS